VELTMLGSEGWYTPSPVDPLEERAWALYCEAIRDSIAQPDDWPGPNTRAEWMFIAAHHHSITAPDKSP
jgi:hypothetical protein